MRCGKMAKAGQGDTVAAVLIGGEPWGLVDARFLGQFRSLRRICLSRPGCSPHSCGTREETLPPRGLCLSRLKHSLTPLKLQEGVDLTDIGVRACQLGYNRVDGEGTLLNGFL